MANTSISAFLTFYNICIKSESDDSECELVPSPMKHKKWRECHILCVLLVNRRFTNRTQVCGKLVQLPLPDVSYLTTYVNTEHEINKTYEAMENTVLKYTQRFVDGTTKGRINDENITF